ncbi:MAG: hypothetical protein A3A61_00050 [Candidatus Woykebacteria bacterium RIFCSPLOWO2_01_FULL_43_14]|uniref:Uncharacterized protein n=1 Tax=Candidatus Woykebacteria bacterium RIFCSPLOWO2_01_FULL_43_14 TaxID=1802605 RepID=A0A1G1WXA3_9BACT|nr:MAG: hypothetical protein A3A61_00050 [Candidatus Woykebacteria bacterium RIFCSPLOWO2_01_FULL_43_14]
MKLTVIIGSARLRGYVVEKDTFCFTDLQHDETFDSDYLYRLAEQGVFIGSKSLVLLAFLFGRGVSKITLNRAYLQIEVESAFFGLVNESEFGLEVMRVINGLYLEELGGDELDGVVVAQ